MRGRFNEIPLGTRCGRWTVTEESERRSQDGARGYVCRCDCGTVRWVRSSNLATGKSRGCGCQAGAKMRALKGTEEAKARMAKARAARKRGPRKKRPDRPYRPKGITQFGMDGWMFRNL